MFKRVKRTSTGIWSRDFVIAKMFSGAKIGRVDRSVMEATMNRIASAVRTGAGVAWTGFPAIAGAERADR